MFGTPMHTQALVSCLFTVLGLVETTQYFRHHIMKVCQQNGEFAG